MVCDATRLIGSAAAAAGWTVLAASGETAPGDRQPTVSDLRLTRGDPAPVGRIADRDADVVIAFHPAAAASPAVTDVCVPGRTVLVSSITPSPLTEAIDHQWTDAAPLADFERWAAAITVAERNWLVDAESITRTVLGACGEPDLLVLGVAVQSGALPIPAPIVETLIEAGGDVMRSGVARSADLSAFRWGRQWVDDPQRIDRLDRTPTVWPDDYRSVGAPLSPPLVQRLANLRLASELHQLVSMLAADLAAYQNEAYVEPFVDLVTRTVGAERLVAVDSTALTEAVARSLHKLLAYKDEYEVARLLVAPEARAAAEAAAGADCRVTWKLQPPTLRARGLGRKLSVGARSARLPMRLLARAKRLRGTALDPFGGTELRRAERSLPSEYIEAMEQALEALDADNLAAATELAASAMDVRGYEQLKLAAIERFRARLTLGVRDRVSG